MLKVIKRLTCIVTIMLMLTFGAGKKAQANSSLTADDIATYSALFDIKKSTVIKIGIYADMVGLEPKFMLEVMYLLQQRYNSLRALNSHQLTMPESEFVNAIGDQDPDPEKMYDILLKVIARDFKDKKQRNYVIYLAGDIVPLANMYPKLMVALLKGDAPLYKALGIKSDPKTPTSKAKPSSHTPSGAKLSGATPSGSAS